MVISYQLQTNIKTLGCILWVSEFVFRADKSPISFWLFGFHSNAFHQLNIFSDFCSLHSSISIYSAQFIGPFSTTIHNWCLIVTVFGVLFQYGTLFLSFAQRDQHYFGHIVTFSPANEWNLYLYVHNW